MSPLLAIIVAAVAAAAPGKPVVSVGIFPRDVEKARPDRSTTYQDIVFLTQVGQTLVEQNEVAEIIPGIANSWEISPDRKVYRFKIRPGLRFHDGTPLTLDDIVHSLNQAIYSPGNASFYFLNVLEGYAKGRTTRRCRGIRTVGDDVLEILLERPYTPLLLALSSGAMVIGKRPSKGDTGAFIGTGPYRVARHGKDTFLEAFSGYIGAYPPRLKRVRLVTDTDAMIGKRRLRSGELPDFFFIYLESVFGTLDKKSYRQVRRPGMLVSGFWLNQNSPKLALLEARIRLVKALQETSIGTLGALPGRPLQDVYPMGMLGHVSGRASYHELQDAAKGSHAAPMAELQVGIFAPMPEGNEAFARRFEKATGMRVSFIQLNHERLLDELRETQADVVFLIWKSVFLDPETNLTPFDFIRSFVRSPRRARFEALRTQATTAVLNADRARIYGEIADLIFKEALFLPVSQLDEIQALRPNLKFSGAIYRYSPMLSELEAIDD